MDSWHKRLEFALQQRKKTPAELARATGNKPPSVSDWLSGQTKMMGGENAVKVCSFLNINHLWLFFGKGPSGLEEGHKTPDLIVLDEASDFIPIKRVEFKITAGITGYEVEFLNGERAPILFRRDWFERKNYKPEKLFAIDVRGQSMEYTLNEGDLVVINTEDTKPADGKIFAVNYEGELVIKRLIRDSGSWWLSSDNPDKRKYPNKICNENCILIGKEVVTQKESN